ncbi:MAG: recombinase family protein [Clostridiales bacterium]|jgi:DNA invertase Pin-like site-specific DNA recombinase|nr:recombinase family protein [Clostridiales bacterium]
MSKYVIAMYIRLSVEDAKTDSLSIPNQRLILGKHIDTLEESNVEVIEFIDNGHTGVNFERPAVQELLEMVRQGGINCIIVKDFSRFGRNSIETGYFIEKVFPVYGVRFISVSDGFDSQEYKGDTGGLQVAFKYLLHEYYSLDLSRKTKSSKYAKMKRGEYQSAVCPFGYKKGADGHMEIDEDAAAVVRLIFDLAAESNNVYRIKKVLFERGIPTPGEYRAAKGTCFHDISRSKGIWQQSTLSRILSDERYTGTYIIGKRELIEVGGRKTRLKDESEWYKIPGHHPAIVSNELYERIQTQALHFKCDKHERQYALRARVYCGCCGHSMARLKRKSPVFSCRFTMVDDNAECRGLEINENELESLIFTVISKQAEVVINSDRLGAETGYEIKTEQTAEYAKLLDKCRDEKRVLYEQFVLGKIHAEQYKAAKASADAEYNRIDRIYSSLCNEAAQMRISRDTDSKSRNTAKAVLNEKVLTQELVDLLIDKVTVYPGNHVEIAWKVIWPFHSENEGRQYTDCSYPSRKYFR